MEGFLPVAHALSWTAISAPFVVRGGQQLTREIRQRPEAAFLAGAAGGFMFLFSALRIPSVTGSSSHPTGAGLGALLFGPSSMAVMGTIVLLFQALLLAHGGLTTLGANVFSMAIVGPWMARWTFRLLKSTGLRLPLVIGVAAACGDLSTYLTTSIQLALAFPGAASGIAGSLLKFLSIYGLTQVPLAIIEGMVTAAILGILPEHWRQ